MERESVIFLHVPKGTTTLVGREYGEQVYKEQIKNYVDGVYHKTLVLPDSIKSVDRSFFCGLFFEFEEEYGQGSAWLLFTVDSANKVLANNANKLLAVMASMPVH